MFKSVIPILLVSFAVSGIATAATHRKSSKPQHSVASKSAASAKNNRVSSSRASSSAAKTAAARSKKNSRSAVSRRGKKVSGRESARRYYQQAPTPERYREIQRALADRGYFRGEVSGAWGPDSVDALRRFQREQNLNQTGKLDSVTIIALGLGPKRSFSAQAEPQPTQSRPEDDHRRSEGSERP